MGMTCSTIGPEELSLESAGIIVLDRARRILFKNQCADAMLAGNGLLIERQERLVSGTAAVEFHLQAALGLAARSPGDISRAPRPVFLPRARHVALMGMIVPLPEETDGAPCALLLLWDPDAMPQLPAGVLIQSFGLTPTEAQTAVATYEGQTPAEIALARRRSIATIRTLLSRAFMKCGVRRQAELVRLLASIGNACSFAEGIKVGIAVERSMRDAGYRHAAADHVQALLIRELARATDMEANVHLVDLDPGQATMPHYHSHGHEVLCVLRGDLTTEFGQDAVHITPAGQARYIGERVLHRGRNRSRHRTVQVLSITVGRRGEAFRIDQPS